MKSIVTIGGGTGQYTLLSGLKKYPVDLTAIVSMADDGGSTGILRDELGVLPPGDVRQCLVALSEAETLMRELFNYRFDEGGLKGHNFGNIFLSALEKTSGNFEEAVRVASSVLAVRGQVVPVTTGNVVLRCDGGDVFEGQNAIDRMSLDEGRRRTLRLAPDAFANPKAVSAIERADCLVIGPGNLFCSIIPNLLVRGVPEAIGRSQARLIYNCNLMTKAGHTDGFGVGDFVDEIERYVGKGRVDYVVYNDTPPESELTERYVQEGQPVAAGPDEFDGIGCVPIGTDLLSRRLYANKAGDPLRRTLIRHDADALAAVIVGRCLGGL
jgi:uncharacterized cofD-like protein